MALGFCFLVAWGFGLMVFGGFGLWAYGLGFRVRGLGVVGLKG